MTDELFLYDRDKGLFKAIIKKSKIFSGRYHVSKDYGHDLNTNNLDAFFKDSLNGLQGPEQKYPLVVCMTPTSRFVTVNGQKWEELFFNLFFLTEAKHTNNQIKKLDRDTNTSGQLTWYDWSDMKQSAADFLEVLRLVIKTGVSSTTLLRTIIQLDAERAFVKRLSEFQNDRLNGVSLSFSCMLFTDACNLKDYDNGVQHAINIPSLKIDH